MSKLIADYSMRKIVSDYSLSEYKFILLEYPLENPISETVGEYGNTLKFHSVLDWVVGSNTNLTVPAKIYHGLIYKFSDKNPTIREMLVNTHGDHIVTRGSKYFDEFRHPNIGDLIMKIRNNIIWGDAIRM